MPTVINRAHRSTDDPTAPTRSLVRAYTAIYGRYLGSIRDPARILNQNERCYAASNSGISKPAVINRAHRSADGPTAPTPPSVRAYTFPSVRYICMISSPALMQQKQ